MADEILFDTQSYSILSLIAKNPGIKKSDIIEKMKGIGSQTKITDIITEMIERKIVIEVKHGRYNIKTYELTPYGEKIYAAMDILHRTIEGEDPIPEEDFVSTPSSDIQMIK